MGLPTVSAGLTSADALSISSPVPGAQVGFVDSVAAPLGVAFTALAPRSEALGVEDSRGPVEVRLSIPGLDRAVSASMAERLVVLALSGCDDTGACARISRVPTSVDVVGGVVGAQVPADLATSSDRQEAPTFVLATEPSGPSGDFTATQSPSLSSWQVGAHTGSAQASYSLVVPPAQVGATPDLTLAYDSGSVDGRMTSKNNQPSWVGLGWEFEPGAITRVTDSCSDGTGTCWLNNDPNAGFALTGGQLSGRLIMVDDSQSPTTVRYRLESNATVVAIKHEDRNRPQGRIVGVDNPAVVGATRSDQLTVMNDSGQVYAYGSAKLCTGNENFPVGPDYVDFEQAVSSGSYWAVTSAGQVEARCNPLSADVAPPPATPVVAMAGSHRNASGNGYVLVTRAGVVYYFGTATDWGQPVSGLAAGDEATDIEFSFDNSKLWVLTKRGRVFEARPDGTSVELGSSSTPPWSYDWATNGDAEALVYFSGGFSVVSKAGGVFTWNMPFAGSASGSVGAGVVDAAGSIDSFGPYKGTWVASAKRVTPTGDARASGNMQPPSPQLPWAVTNPDAWGTWWEVITGDGTRQFFGRGYDPFTNAATFSVRTIPFEQPDQPGPALCQKRCDGAYQWDLDLVETPANHVTRALTWRWAQEPNWVPIPNRDGLGAVRWSYVRAAHPAVLAYGGAHDYSTVGPRSRVVFQTVNRCPEAIDSAHNTCPTTWPDTPIDLLCGPVLPVVCAGGNDRITFFSMERLWRAETSIRTGTFPGWLWQLVNNYDFEVQWPDPNAGEPDPDGSEPKMVLSSATRKRVDDDTDPAHQIPPASWGYVMANNRVHHPGGVSPMRMPRLNGMVTELGGRVTFNLGQTKEFGSSNCGPSFPNGFIRLPCDVFPVFDASACDNPDIVCDPSYAAWVLFNKYKVLSTVVEDDTDSALGTGQARYETTYDYSEPAWAYSQKVAGVDLGSGQCGVGSAKGGRCNHWSDFRGHQYVAIHHPDGTGTEIVTFTGMRTDRLNGNGGTYFGPPIEDIDHFPHTNDRAKAGLQLESNTRAVNGAILGHQVADYNIDLRAGIGSIAYWLVTPAGKRSRSYGDDGCREADVVESYVHDSFGNQTQLERYTQDRPELGPCWRAGTPTIGLRTTTTYSINNLESVYLAHLPRQTTTKTYNPVTGTTGAVVADSMFFYDGDTSWATLPTVGELTSSRTQQRASQPSSEWALTATAYDDFGRVKSSTDANGHTTRYTYDVVTGAVATITAPTGEVRRFGVDQRFGGTTRIVDPATGITSAGYDGYGRLLWVNDADGFTAPPRQEYVYGLSPSRTNPVVMKSVEHHTSAGASKHEGWTISDGWGRVIQTQDAAPAGSAPDEIRRLSSTAYDSFGRPFQQSAPYLRSGVPGSTWLVPDPEFDGLESFTRTEYDPKGEVERVLVLGRGTAATTTTHRDGLRTAMTDSAGRTTTSTFNPLGQMVSVVEPAGGGTTRFTYDPAGRMDLVMDAAGNRTQATWNMDGTRERLSDPDMGLLLSTHDAGGRLLTTTNAAGATLWHRYDASNRLLELRNGTSSGQLLARWTYNPTTGTLSSSEAYPEGGSTPVTITYGYDARGRTTAKTWQSSMIPTGQLTMGWTYNRDGTSATTTYPTGETLTHTYNTLGLQTQLAGWATYVSQTAYNEDDRLASRRTSTEGQGGGFMELLTYDTMRNWLTHKEVYTAANNAQTAADSFYTRDSLGNVISADELDTGQRQCFGNDNLDRLTSAYTTSTALACNGYRPEYGPDAYSASWAYNSIGNITSASGAGTANGSYSYSDSSHAHAVTQAGNIGLTYNVLGAVATRTNSAQPAQTFGYDLRQRLASISQGSTTTSFVYDADGARIARTHQTTVTLSYDGWIEDTVVAGQHTARTVHYKANGQMIANRIIPMAAGSPPGEQAPITWYTHDEVGTIAATRTGNGAPSRQRTYPFGADRTANPSPQTEHNYIGQTLDPTGLYHLGARYYDPLLGRFLAVDPLATLTEPQKLNAYNYAGNNPITQSDPTGLDPQCRGSNASPKCSIVSRSRKYTFNQFGFLMQVLHYWRGAADITSNYRKRSGTPNDRQYETYLSQCAYDVADCAGAAALQYGATLSEAADYSSAVAQSSCGNTMGCDIGATYEDGWGNFVIDSIATLGTGFIVKRALTGLAGRLLGGETVAGRGAVVQVNESMPARAAAFQAEVTGLPQGTAYRLGGVDFDGFTNGVLLEAKGPGYATFVRGGEFKPWFQGADDMVSQASRQLNVAGGTPVQWVVAEPETATAIRNLFAENGISGVNVVG